MSIQIKAEFESVDAAEIASRYMRAHLEGIEHIHILSRKKPATTYDPTGRFVYGATSDNKDLDNRRGHSVAATEPSLRRDAVLSVTVSNPMERACAGMMRSLGGMRVSQNAE